MRIVAYYALHYGREWLHWSMKSIRDHVDDIVVVYTPAPSHGTRTPYVCPETEDELMAIAQQFDAKWHHVTNGFRHEGMHRDFAVDLCKNVYGADIILPLDHDELWDDFHLKSVLAEVMNTDAMTYRVPMQHFWRSVNWVCRDPLMPVRAIKPSGKPVEHYCAQGERMHMHHFGYAQSPQLIEYKWRIHGHINEQRKGWFDDIFMQWPATKFDVHPTNIDFWTPAAFDKKRLTGLIGDHPYYQMDVIDNSLVDKLDNNSVVDAFDGSPFGVK